MVRTKRINAKLRLDLEVLAQKVIDNEGKIDSRATVGFSEEKKEEFDQNFPPLTGVEPRATAGEGTIRNWANVVAPNRERASGAELEFVPPVEENGMKVVRVMNEDVQDEINRWKKALVVYVLGAKPPFMVMKKFFERK